MSIYGLGLFFVVQGKVGSEKLWKIIGKWPMIY